MHIQFWSRHIEAKPTLQLYVFPKYPNDDYVLDNNILYIRARADICEFGMSPFK